MVPNGKNLPEIRFENFVKLIHNTYFCNSLTNFLQGSHSMSGYGNNVKLTETCLEKKCEIPLIDPFLGGFKLFATIVQKGQQRITCQKFS